MMDAALLKLAAEAGPAVIAAGSVIVLNNLPLSTVIVVSLVAIFVLARAKHKAK